MLKYIALAALLLTGPLCAQMYAQPVQQQQQVVYSSPMDAVNGLTGRGLGSSRLPVIVAMTGSGNQNVLSGQLGNVYENGIDFSLDLYSDRTKPITGAGTVTMTTIGAGGGQVQVVASGKIAPKSYGASGNRYTLNAYQWTIYTRSGPDDTWQNRATFTKDSKANWQLVGKGSTYRY